MNRAELLAKIQKATIETGAGGQLKPKQDKAFIQRVMEVSAFGKAINLVRPGPEPKGEFTKMGNSPRLIRRHTENTDTGYRAGITTDDIEYDATTVHLPFEITENFFHTNLEGEAVEPKIVDRMARQFALDLDDLNWNGDEEDSDDFVSLDDGILKICETSSDVHRVDAQSLDSSGAMDKEVWFALKYAMPDIFVNSGRLRWFMSPNRWTSWIEYLTGRETAAGDAALMAKDLYPLGIPPFVGAASDDSAPMPGVPFMPDDRIILADPKNFDRVITWDTQRYRVTGATDWELAMRRKRGYVTFLTADFIIEEEAAVADLHGLDPITLGAGSGSGS